jgi:hypothetical protein
MDISNFYLMTPLHHPEFVCINLINISDEVIEEYKLKEKATKSGSINILVKRGMYGLPQSGLLANKLLKRQSNAHRCDTDKPTKKTGTQPLETLFTPKQFTLVVYDYGVKYVVIEHCQQPQIRCSGGNSEKPIAPYLAVGQLHRLISVFPTDHSRSLLPIFWNDPLGLLGWPG